MAATLYAPDPAIAQSLQQYLSQTHLSLTLGEPSGEGALLVVDTDIARLQSLRYSPKVIATAPTHITALQSHFPNARFVALPLRIDSLMQQLLRGSSAQNTAPIPCIENWQLEGDHLVCSLPETAKLHLTDKEAELLRHLLANRNEVLSRETLLQQVWHYEPSAQTNTLETHMYRLRGKLAPLSLPDGCGIITKENGYMWADSAKNDA